MALQDESSVLISPYGGELVNLLIDEGEADELRSEANRLPSVQLTERAVCDLELLGVGGYSPLNTFMNQQDYQCVLEEMRLANGTLFPVPVTLPVDADASVSLDQPVALRDTKNSLLAILEVEEIYRWDLDREALAVLGTLDQRHPLVAEMHGWGALNLSGKLRAIQLPHHADFRGLRHTPAQTRTALESKGRQNVVAFQTRNPLHRVHEELTKQAAESIDGALLLHPVVGLTKPGDVDHYTRVRTYKALTDKYYDRDRVLLSLLPLAMRMGGPREAVWHAIIRRNYGANHLIVGRDHAGVGDYYGAFDAQEIFNNPLVKKSLIINIFAADHTAYSKKLKKVVMMRDVKNHAKDDFVLLSGTKVREMLSNGQELPSEFARKEVAEILMDYYQSR